MDTITIERLGHKGDGIAPGPIFVPGTLPGEQVQGDVVDGVMAAPRIVTPVEARVKPPCSHARSCGGCQLQHARDDFVADWKTDVVRRALDAHGLSTDLRPCVTSPVRSRRRAAFSARRTKKGALAGFHQKASDVVVSVPNCTLVTPMLAQSLTMVEALAVLGSSRKGELSVLVTQSLNGLDVAVTGGKDVDAAMRSALADLAREFDLARLSWGDETLTRHAAVQRFGSAEVTPPPGAFMQATAEGEAALLDGVKEALGPLGKNAKLADLFAGCGTFALPLAEIAQVHAVEGDGDMMAALDHGWRTASGVKLVTHETRDLFRNPLMLDELDRLDGVVIDPPRAGAEAQVREIARARVPKVAHVSCNPVTFARDCATLVEAGYVLDFVQPVDQFRWSTHVEVVAGLTLDA